MSGDPNLTAWRRTYSEIGSRRLGYPGPYGPKNGRWIVRCQRTLIASYLSHHQANRSVLTRFERTVMSKRINIKSLLQASDSLKHEGFTGFLKYYGIEIKNAEIQDLKSLVKALGDIGCSIGAFDQFYVGYKIPQIGKEFDLLRFGRKYILNIELKSNSTEEKIEKQLVRNKYYLSFIGRDIQAFTYVSESQELYFLGDDGQLAKAKLEFLAELLSNQSVDDLEVPDSLFDPSDYLVSPFNSTKKFLAGEYFLTLQQEEMKNQVLNSLESPKAAKFISIIGSAGTGKTLLTFDIAKHLIVRKKTPLIIHCGQLNNGHAELIKRGWSIAAIKGFTIHNFEDFDLVIVDEAQRLYPEQLDAIIEKARIAKCCCIFSHDKLQTLANWEKQRDVSAKISSISQITQYKLSEKIRSNKEIASFIKMIFNNKRSLPISIKGNIEINYFNTTDDAKNYLDALDEKKWEILRFTPSQYNNEHHEKYSKISKRTSHQVIGQEFDGVAIMIDRYFSYDENGNLIYKGDTYYDPPQMLFQNITRARKRLNLIIIGNEELLNRCITILQ
jgi:cytidylate kinase